MAMTLGELAGKIGAVVARGDAALRIEGLASLAQAGPAHLAPFTDKNYSAELRASKAGALLTKSLEFAEEAPAAAAILTVNDPDMALIQALQLIYPRPVENFGVSPQASIEPGVEIGADVYVGPFAVVRTGTKIGARSVIHSHAVIGRGCEIGEGSEIHPHATLYDGVKIGKRVIIHSGAVIGADGFGYKFRGGKHVKVPQVGDVVLGDDVEVGANTCIDRGALSSTQVGQGSKLDNLVQVGHNNVVGNHVILCGQAALAGSCVIEDYVVLGGGVGVADHMKVGKGARAGAHSGIGKDVPPGAEVWGFYAEERQLAFRSLATYRRLPELAKKVRELESEIKALKESAKE